MEKIAHRLRTTWGLVVGVGGLATCLVGALKISDATSAIPFVLLTLGGWLYADVFRRVVPTGSTDSSLGLAGWGTLVMVSGSILAVGNVRLRVVLAIYLIGAVAGLAVLIASRLSLSKALSHEPGGRASLAFQKAANPCL